MRLKKKMKRKERSWLRKNREVGELGRVAKGI